MRLNSAKTLIISSWHDNPPDIDQRVRNATLAVVAGRGARSRRAQCSDTPSIRLSAVRIRQLVENIAGQAGTVGDAELPHPAVGNDFIDHFARPLLAPLRAVSENERRTSIPVSTRSCGRRSRRPDG